MKTYDEWQEEGRQVKIGQTATHIKGIPYFEKHQTKNMILSESTKKWMRNKSKTTEQEILNDLNNVIFGVCEHNSVASTYYDELVIDYHQNGEKSAYELLDNMVRTEQLNNEEKYLGRN